MSSTLVLNGNPKKDSFCKALAESYANGVTASGHTVNLIHLSNLDFAINLEHGYDQEQALEPDLLYVQKSLHESSHIVIVSPSWWGSVPAKLKGLIDRVILPGFGFKYLEGQVYPEQLLKGKTCRLILTMDSPGWYHKYIYGDPIVKTFKKPTLGLCGIKLKNVQRLGPIMTSTHQQRTHWINITHKAAIADSSKK